VVWLHEDEMNHKLQYGLDALLDVLEAGGVYEILDAGRASALKKANPWWKFW